MRVAEVRGLSQMIRLKCGARARRCQHEAGNRRGQQQQSGDAHDVRSGVAEQNVAVKLVQCAQQVRRTKAERFQRACAELRPADGIEHGLDTLGADPARLSAKREPINSADGLGKADLFNQAERVGGFGALDNRLRTEVRAAGGRGQQPGVEPSIQRVFEHKQGAAQPDQREPQPEANAQPAVDGKPD